MLLALHGAYAAGLLQFLDVNDLLALGAERARHVRRVVLEVDQDLDLGAERQLIELELGAQEGVGTQLAGEIELGHQAISTSAATGLSTIAWPRPRSVPSARRMAGG